MPHNIIQRLVTNSGWRDYEMLHSTYATREDASAVAARMNAESAAYRSELHFTVESAEGA